MDEFALIERYFAQLGHADGVALGIGDDAAVLAVPPGEQLVVATDTLVAGVHFPVGEAPDAIGYRAVAVNVSDLAAMAARPRWFTLALTIPDVDTDWLAGFADGLRDAAADNRLALVGGDTTAGPLSVTVTLLGSVAAGEALTRAGARPGERLYVSGRLGEAAGGLACLQAATETTSAEQYLLKRFRRPPSRWRLVAAHRSCLSAAIDVSDGLLADAGHLGAASGVGVAIELAPPGDGPLTERFGAAAAATFALTGGDDYEVLVAAPADQDQRLTDAGFLPVGHVIANTGVFVDGREVDVDERRGYRHFEARHD